MGNVILERALGEVYKREFSEFDNAPDHRFSLKHRIKMRRTFNLFKKSCLKTQTVRISLKRKLAAVAVIIILAVSGCAAVIIGRFVSEERNEGGVISALNTDDGKPLIDELYFISELPAGYALGYESDLGEAENKLFYRIYYNDKNSALTLYQYTYETFEIRFSLDYTNIEQVTINQTAGYYIHQAMSSFGSIIWCGGGYVFEVDGNMPRDELIRIAQSVEISPAK